MGFHPNFPSNPFLVIDPDIRWYPGEDIKQRDSLIPPLVNKVRKGVKNWRDANYEGASSTTKALLNHWFNKEHTIIDSTGSEMLFSWYFSQREAIESAIWLYEVQKAKDPNDLLKYDSSGKLTPLNFSSERVGDWPRYVLKLATGTGKTKVLSLLIAWCFFHKKYEENSDLSTNFLLISPNIIVLDRLKLDFDRLKIFNEDPILPDNGYEERTWRDDFKLNLHFQDEISQISDSGNLFLTNIHRVFLGTSRESSFEDEDTSDYFLGPKPSGKTAESKLDLGLLIRTIPNLVILNDEAHHIHDPKLAWFKNLQDIDHQLKNRGEKLSVQFDVTATPRDENAVIFPQTISDYPLTEAIHQGIIKRPVLPDRKSRVKLIERVSDDVTEKYQDYIQLGYLEWKKSYEEYKGYRKAVLFIMTDDTNNCDKVQTYLERRYPDLMGAVLVIHTKRDGTLDEGRGKEIDWLRKQSREIDRPDNPYKVIVSVLMLREGWDVKNVTTIVGLRAFTATSKILPEQTLGRGLRKMSSDPEISEWLSVIGTDEFMEFVELIKYEGVDLEYQPMDEYSPPKAPSIIRTDKSDELDIELPILHDSIRKEYSLNELYVDLGEENKINIIDFSDQEKREVVFRDINTEEIDHTIFIDLLEETSEMDRSVRIIGFFARQIMSDLHLVSHFDVLYEKIKKFIQSDLFRNQNTPVDLNDLNIMRNLSETVVKKTIIETFKRAINNLTKYELASSGKGNTIKLINTGPFELNEKNTLHSNKCIFNKIVCDNQYELGFAIFLDGCEDIISFSKNYIQIGFYINYVKENGALARYYPDFIIKKNQNEIWIIELKGREDLNDLVKKKRLTEWCKEATIQEMPRTFNCLYIKEEDWSKYKPRNFLELCDLYKNEAPKE